MSGNKPKYFYKVVEGTNPEKELTKITIRRVDYGQLAPAEVTGMLNDIASVFPPEKYRLGHTMDLFDEVLSVYLNRPTAERLKRGGNPFVGIIVSKSEVDNNLRALSRARPEWIPAP